MGTHARFLSTPGPLSRVRPRGFHDNGIEEARTDAARRTQEGAAAFLLHSCCAPCSGEVIEATLASGIDYTIFFYNPNIHPEKEYLLRKGENIRFAEKHGVICLRALVFGDDLVPGHLALERHESDQRVRLARGRTL